MKKTHAAGPAGLCLLALVLSLGACKPTVAPPPVKPTFSNIDTFYEEVAKRVAKKVGAENIPDFIVTPSQGSWPIGTVLRPGAFIPADARACVPEDRLIVSAATPNLFPDFESSSGHSGELGLDSGVIKRLAQLGVRFSDQDQVTIKVSDSQLQLMDDSTYERIFANPACRAVVAGKERWIVRGYAIGRRTFAFSNTTQRAATVGVEKIANFALDLGSGKGTLQVSDEQPEKFVALISSIKLEQGVIKSTTPAVQSGQGRIYVQKDRQDSSKVSQAVVAALRGADFQVERQVEAIDSERMPRQAQLRYFNEADRELANRVLELLKAQLPDITLLRMRLPAPAGQMEVWLPRVQSANS